LYNSVIRRGNLGKEASAKRPFPTVDRAKIFVVCNQEDLAPVWGSTLRQGGLMELYQEIPISALEVAGFPTLEKPGNVRDCFR
jgi:hypothetical protein